MSHPEYYQHWKAKKLASDPNFFKHNYQRQVARYGHKYLNELSAKWRNSEEGQEYHKKYREEHKDYHSEKYREWRESNRAYHSKRVNDWMDKHPEVAYAQYAANHGLGEYHPVPLAKWCEVCPEDDLREATQRHHPDYNYPTIIVSCCQDCHTYLNRERKKNESKEGRVNE